MYTWCTDDVHIVSSAGPTQNVLVEGPGEVDIEELLVVDGQSHHPTSKTEVAEVVWVHVRMAIGLECSSWAWSGMGT